MKLKIFVFCILLTPLTVVAAGSHAGGHHDDTQQHNHASAHHTGSHGQSYGNKVGNTSSADKAQKTVHVSMLDSMRFEYSEPLAINRGDVIRFVVTNQGKIRHEFSIGDEQEQRAHAEMMRKMPNMVHTDGNTLSLAPGEAGELTWQFVGDPNVVFACNIPGHAEAGMLTRHSINLFHQNGHNH